ncbi:MAG: hypothetical protein KIT81_15240 [Alphaproteobacteria bacterium]|nr:hypothetical protein [Alphaproteobacteria bacterium]
MNNAVIRISRFLHAPMLALVFAALLGGCDGLPAFAGFGAADPLQVGREELVDEATGRRGTLYSLAPGQALPAQARRWLALDEWQAMELSEKLDAIEAEQRRGNLLLAEDGAIHVLPEAALARPDRPAPAFRKVTPGQQ